jgi:hypothetical protein
MKRAWYVVCLAALAPLGVAVGCGDDDKAKQDMQGDGGAGAEGGGPGDPSSAGSSTEPGAAGQGGAATEPGSGGNGGAAINGGAPTAVGGADGSSGGADGSSGGADGSAGADGGGAFTNACAYPNGGACDEIAGTFEQAGSFELQCLNNERLPLDSCPTANIAGVCTFEQGGARFRTIHYNPIDVDELADAEQNCLELPGEWTTP